MTIARRRRLRRVTRQLYDALFPAAVLAAFALGWFVAAATHRSN